MARESRMRPSKRARVCAQSALGKAAIGTVGPVQSWATEAQTLHLAYPQKPLNKTAVADALDLGDDVQNCLLAIVTSPSTTEDSYMVNLSAVQRGLFTRSAYRYYKASSSGPADGAAAAAGGGGGAASYDVIQLPPPEMLQQYPERYAHLDADGIVRVGQVVKPGMILISVQHVTNNKAKDSSTTQRCGEDGVVDKVVVAEGAKPGSVAVTVIVRSWLRILPGDKISTMVCGIFFRKKSASVCCVHGNPSEPHRPCHINAPTLPRPPPPPPPRRSPAA